MGDLHLSDERLLFAQNALIARQPELALERLAAAIEVGWRDYYLMQHDPRWEGLRETPRFRELMAGVERDIAAQRVQVEAIDAADDFAARLEWVLAAAQPAR